MTERDDLVERVAAGEERVTVPIEWDYKQSQAFDERTMSWRYKITATPTKYASVPASAIRAATGAGE